MPENFVYRRFFDSGSLPAPSIRKKNYIFMVG